MADGIIHNSLLRENPEHSFVSVRMPGSMPVLGLADLARSLGYTVRRQADGHLALIPAQKVAGACQ